MRKKIVVFLLAWTTDATEILMGLNLYRNGELEKHIVPLNVSSNLTKRAVDVIAEKELTPDGLSCVDPKCVVEVVTDAMRRTLENRQRLIDGDPRFGICVVTKHSDLTEWIAWHQMQGVTEFYIYDNNDDTRYGIPWYRGEELTMRRQLEAYVDCVPRAQRDGVLWLAFIDDDEYLISAIPGHRFKETLLDQDVMKIDARWIYPKSFGRWWAPGTRFPADVCPGTRTDFSKTIAKVPCVTHISAHNVFVEETGLPGCPRRRKRKKKTLLDKDEASNAGLWILHYHYASLQEWLEVRVERLRQRRYYDDDDPTMGPRFAGHGLIDMPFYADICHPDFYSSGSPPNMSTSFDVRVRPLLSTPEATRIAVDGIQVNLHKAAERLLPDESSESSGRRREPLLEREYILSPRDLRMDPGGTDYAVYVSLKRHLLAGQELDPYAYWRKYTSAAEMLLPSDDNTEALRAAALYHYIHVGLFLGADTDKSLWKETY